MYNQNVLAAAPIGCDVHSKDRRLMTVALSNNVFGCSYLMDDRDYPRLAWKAEFYWQIT